MAEHRITDETLFKDIGLTDAELRDMQAKFQRYVHELNPTQIQSLSASLPTAAVAASTLSPDVTPERLDEFIRERAPRSATIVLYNKECC